MEPLPCSASAIAKLRFDSYLNEKLKGAWDINAWEFYTYLLEQAKNHPIDTSGFASSDYQLDVKEAGKNYKSLYPSP